MKIRIIEEHGYDTALRGMAYSYKDRAINPEAWWPGQRDKAIARAPKLAPMGGGHNKFLRQMQVWVDIEACRAWWSEFDTYKVGTVANSESSMHTLSKRPPTREDFEQGTTENTYLQFKDVWQVYKGDVSVLKMNLPEGFLQRRVVTMNYDNLRNIFSQREGHRLKWWDVFIQEMLKQVEHPEFLVSALRSPPDNDPHPIP